MNNNQKPTIEKELKEEWEYTCNLIASALSDYKVKEKEAIQNTMKELKKDVFISTSLSKQESNEAVKWSDLEKVFGKVE